MSDSDRPSRPSRSQDGRGRHARPDERQPRRIYEAPEESTASSQTQRGGRTTGEPDRTPRRSSASASPSRAASTTASRTGAARAAGVTGATAGSARRPRSTGPADYRQLGPTPVKIVLSLIAVLLLVGGGYGYTTIGRLSEDLTQTGSLNLGEQADGATDILLVGLDSRTDAQGNPLSQEEIDMLRAGEEATSSTDTMILIRIPNDGSSATAVSLPRDTYVDGGPELGNTKLNAVYGTTKFLRQQEFEEEALANGVEIDQARMEEESTQAGREALISTIADLTGISVDHYAEVGLLGFVLLTDAVGGVDVCLNNAVYEPLSGADFPAGLQTLDGQNALSFVRQRHDLPRGDLDRITRQQAYLASLANKILSAKTLSSPSQLSKLNEAVARSLTIDSGWDIMGLATQMQNLTGGNVTFQTIPVTSIDGTSEDGQSVVTVDKKQVRAFFEELSGESESEDSSDTGTTAEEIPDYDPAASTVSVLNASSVDGLASRVGDLVAGAGFAIGEVGNLEESGVSESQVNVADTSDPAARDLAEKLGGLAVVEDPSLEPGQISITLSGTYTGPGATEDDTRTLDGDYSDDGYSDDSSDVLGTPGTMEDTTSEQQEPISAGTDGPMCVN